MPKITLENGIELTISQESYDAFVKAVKKSTNYNDIAEELFLGNQSFFINDRGEIAKYVVNTEHCTRPNLAKTKEQLESILAFNMWLNVAEFLNERWKPNWKDANQYKHYPRYYVNEDKIVADYWTIQIVTSGPWFKSANLVKRSIEILGVETCKKALGVYV